MQRLILSSLVLLEDRNRTDEKWGEGCSSMYYLRVNQIPYIL